MSASNFHRDHAKHISTSEKLSDELRKTGQDILKQINTFHEITSDQIFTKVINVVIRGLYAIIPDLEEIVIKSNTEKESNADLKDVVKSLSQYCNEVVQEFNKGDSSILKQKFIIFIQNVLRVAEDLLNIIKKDSHHDFKYELVDNLKEMMYMIQTAKSRIQVENYTNEELINLVKGIQKEYFEDISIIQNYKLDVLKAVAIHIKYNVRHVFQMAYYLNKVASNYHNPETQHKILQAAYALNVANSTALLDMSNIEKFNSTNELIKALTDYVINSWNALLGLFEFLDVRIENKKASENLKDIAKFVASYGVVINAHIGRSIKNDGSFA